MGLGIMGPNEDVSGLSVGDCDAPNFDMISVCAESHIEQILG